VMLMADETPPPRRAGPLEVVKAVLAAFIGIRRRSAHERDAVSLTPLQVMVAGIVLAAVFVVSLVMLARYVAG
jgi:hypothetical protein